MVAVGKQDVEPLWLQLPTEHAVDLGVAVLAVEPRSIRFRFRREIVVAHRGTEFGKLKTDPAEFARDLLRADPGMLPARINSQAGDANATNLLDLPSSAARSCLGAALI